MIESKCYLVGEISTKQSLEGEVSNAIKYLDPVTQEKTVDSSIELQEITPDKDYTGLSKVTINPVTNQIDQNIKSENIKQGIDILGVTGNVEELNTTEISINPSDVEKVVTPEAPYNGFSKVTVGAQSGINPAEYFETIVTSSNTNKFGINTLIKKIPNIIIEQSVKKVQYLFQNAYYLKSVNLIIDDNKELNCYATFYGCSNLTEVKGLENAKITNAEQMFYGCSNLTSIPNVDTSLCGDFDSIFQNCRSITIVNNIDTSNATNMSMAFSGCQKLEEVHNLNTSKVRFFSHAFSYCRALNTIDKLNATSCDSIYDMFQSCSNLTNLGGFKDLGKAYSTTQSANYNSYTLNLSSCNKLTHESLMNVINNLYDIASAGVKPQQLQLGSTNLAKLTDEEKAIATNKGWSLS